MTFATRAAPHVRKGGAVWRLLTILHKYPGRKFTGAQLQHIMINMDAEGKPRDALRPVLPGDDVVYNMSWPTYSADIKRLGQQGLLSRTDVATPTAWRGVGRKTSQYIYSAGEKSIADCVVYGG